MVARKEGWCRRLGTKQLSRARPRETQGPSPVSSSSWPKAPSCTCSSYSCTPNTEGASIIRNCGCTRQARCSLPGYDASQWICSTLEEERGYRARLQRLKPNNIASCKRDREQASARGRCEAQAKSATCGCETEGPGQTTRTDRTKACIRCTRGASSPWGWQGGRSNGSRSNGSSCSGRLSIPLSYVPG